MDLVRLGTWMVVFSGPWFGAVLGCDNLLSDFVRIIVLISSAVCLCVGGRGKSGTVVILLQLFNMPCKVLLPASLYIRL